MFFQQHVFIEQKKISPQVLYHLPECHVFLNIHIAVNTIFEYRN